MIKGSEDELSIGSAPCVISCQPSLSALITTPQGYFCLISQIERDSEGTQRRQWQPTLAWKIPWMEEPGRLQSMGSPRDGHN